MKFSIVSIVGAGALAAIAAMTACGSDAPTTPDARLSPSLVLNKVTVSPQAAVLGTGGTQQLSVTAVAVDSTPVTTHDTVYYLSNDSTRVQVSSSGLVTAATGSKALTGSQPVRVVASWVKDGVTRVDTCLVTVVAAAGTNPVFSIADATAATVKLESGVSKSLASKLTYTVAGAPVSISGAAVPIKFTVTPGNLASQTGVSQFTPFSSQGTVFVTATTTAFGVTLTDTITYMLGDPKTLTVVFANTGLVFYQAATAAPANAYNISTTLYLRVGGAITFSNNLTGKPYVFNVGFTALSGVAPDSALNLNGTIGTNRKVVTFTTAGTYTYVWGGDAASLAPLDKRTSTIVVRP